MKKSYIVGIMLASVLALGAVSASAAFAEETAQWLVNGAAIQLSESVHIDILGLLLLQDPNAPGNADIHCEIVGGLGFLLSNGVDETTEGTCPAPGVESGTCGSPKVKPLHLPWTTQLVELEGGVFHDGITKGTGGAPGWEAECTIFGIKAKDICTTEKGFTTDTNTEDGLVLANFEEGVPKEDLANCSIGGAEQGLVVGTVELHALNAAEELISLSVSLGPVVE